MIHFLKRLVSISFLYVLTSSVSFASEVWNLDINIPGGDQNWSKVDRLWQLHWEEQDVSALLEQLELMLDDGAVTNDRLELYLWLSKAYYLHARYRSKGRVDSLKASEQYAVKALSVDPANVVAKKLLVTSVVSYADRAYMEQQYTQVMKDALPIKEERAVPLFKENTQFMSVLSDWDSREDIDKALKAVNAFNEIAEQNSDKVLAQLWASRGYYYLGYYHVGLNDFDKASPYFEKGKKFGEKAIKLDPNNFLTRYWYQLNLARVIQNASILTKARYLNEMTNHLVFVANENMTYFYNAATNSIATILEKGGWVAEKGMGMAGYSMDMVRNASEISMVAFPTYFYTYFARAKILYRDGNKDEAKEILERVLKMDPYINPYHAPENIIVQKLVEAYLKEYY